MSRHLRFVMGAALAISSVGLIGCDDKTETKVTTPDGKTGTVTVKTDAKTDNAVTKTGDAVKEGAKDVGDSIKHAGDKVAESVKDAMSNESAAQARNTLKEVVNAALTKDGFNDLVERLSDADRDRLGDPGKADYEDINMRVADIQAGWKAKYGHEFDLNKEDVVFNNVILTEVAKDGVNTGALTIPAAKDMPMLMLPLKSSGTSWKIDVADTISGAQLHDAVLNHLKMVGDMKTSWPADEMDAYRAVAYHVLSALSGK